MKTLLLMLVGLGMMALGSEARAAGDAERPEVVVQGLYRSALEHFGFSPDTVKACQPWVTPELYARLWKKVNEPVPKGDAPDIEGDVFLDSQDPPIKFGVGQAAINSTKAQVGVMLIWPGASGERRQVSVLLKRIDGAWKVDDVNYGKDGKLSDLLK